MRILHLTKKYPNAIGGDATVVSNLEKEQVKHGHTVYILTSNCKEILNKTNIYKFGLLDSSATVDHINIKRLISLIILYFSSFKYVRRLKPDVVIAHSIDFGVAFNLASKLNKIPVIYMAHCGLFSFNRNYPFRRIIEKITLKYINFDKVITVNPNDLKFITDEKKYKYVPNGVDLNAFKFNTKHRDNICLYVGRLEEYKGIVYLILGIKILVQRNVKVKLLIIGDGPQEKVLKQQVTKLNLDNEVKFIHSVNQNKMSEYYRKAIVTVLPSFRIEGFGLVLLESMACGTPVITTNISGLSKDIAINKTGIIVKTQSSTDIARAVTQLINNEITTKNMQINARSLVESKYNWKKISKVIETIYLN